MGIKIIAKNKRASYDYFLSEKLEAGIQLKGTEVKSLRKGKGSISESHVGIDSNGEMWIYNMLIPQYEFGNINNHQENRTRKLLLHTKEIVKLSHAMKAGSMTIVPTIIYFKNSLVKIEIEDFPKDIKINGRSFELNQAIVNLVNNAIDAAENTVEKWIKVYHKLKGRQIIVYIEDSGNGIPAHIYENMTSPFFTTKEVGKGTGLGLSTAIGIIESHGGELRYLPDKKNTVFTFSLPIV